MFNQEMSTSAKQHSASSKEDYLVTSSMSFESSKPATAEVSTMEAGSADNSKNICFTCFVSWTKYQTH